MSSLSYSEFIIIAPESICLSGTSRIYLLHGVPDVTFYEQHQLLRIEISLDGIYPDTISGLSPCLPGYRLSRKHSGVLCVFYCSRNAEIEEIAVLLLALSVSANYLKSICIEFVATTLGKC